MYTRQDMEVVGTYRVPIKSKIGRDICSNPLFIFLNAFLFIPFFYIPICGMRYDRCNFFLFRPSLSRCLDFLGGAWRRVV